MKAEFFVGVPKQVEGWIEADDATAAIPCWFCGEPLGFSRYFVELPNGQHQHHRGCVNRRATEFWNPEWDVPARSR